MTQPAMSVLMSARDGAPWVRDAAQRVLPSGGKRVSAARDGERLSAEALLRRHAVRSGLARPLVAGSMPPAGGAR